MTAAAEIGDMAALRREIDAIDAELVRLLAHRSTMIERAIELKPREGLPARIESRVQDVLERAGIEFLADDDGLGVRLKAPSHEWA